MTCANKERSVRQRPRAGLQVLNTKLVFREMNSQQATESPISLSLVIAMWNIVMHF